LQVVTSLQKIPAFSLSVIPAEAGILSSGASSWKIPAYAGMTGELIGNDENQPCRHPRGIYPVIPAEAGILSSGASSWKIPAFAGMTVGGAGMTEGVDRE